MSGVLSPQQRSARHSLLWPVVTLAAWRLRRTWFLLLFITLGMVAAVVIACTIPLLSSVMTTAGLRSTLRATPESDEIAVYAGDPGIATPIVQAAYNEFAPLFRHYLGDIVQPTQFSTTINDFSFPLSMRIRRSSSTVPLCNRLRPNLERWMAVLLV